MDLIILNLFIVLIASLSIASFAGLLSDKVGIFNVSIEGNMIFGVLVFMTVAPNFGAAVALIFALAVGLLWTMIYSYFINNLNGEQSIVGTMMNILAITTAILIAAHVGTGNSLYVSPEVYMFSGAFNLTFMVYAIVALIVVVTIWLVMKRSKWGKWISASGENPIALDASGVSVLSVRWWTTLTVGLLATLAGVMFSGVLITVGQGFIGTIYGFGYLVVAIVIIAGSTRIGATIWSGILAFSFAFLIGTFATPTSSNDASPEIWLAMGYALPIVFLVFARLASKGKVTKTILIFVRNKPADLRGEPLKALLWFFPWVIVTIPFALIFFWPLWISVLFKRKDEFIERIMTGPSIFVGKGSPRTLGKTYKKGIDL